MSQMRLQFGERVPRWTVVNRSMRAHQVGDDNLPGPRDSTGGKAAVGMGAAGLEAC